jgi:hypothetical protein
MSNDTSGVMAGLVPAIHVFTTVPQGHKDVDARDKRGHDDGDGDSIRPISGLAAQSRSILQ